MYLHIYIDIHIKLMGLSNHYIQSTTVTCSTTKSQPSTAAPRPRLCIHCNFDIQEAALDSHQRVHWWPTPDGD